MSTRKLYRSLLLALALCSILIFVVSGQTWATAYFIEENTPQLVYQFTGRQLQPIVAGVVVVPIVGVVGLIAAKKIFQQIVGFIIFIAGLTITYYTYTISTDWVAVLDPLVTGKVGRTGIDYTIETNSLNTLLIVPAIGIAMIGLVFTFRRFDLVKKRAAYDAPTAASVTLSPWQAMDMGIDPTISDSDSGAAGAAGDSSS